MSAAPNPKAQPSELMPFSFAFARLNALHAVRYSHSERKHLAVAMDEDECWHLVAVAFDGIGDGLRQADDEAMIAGATRG